MAMLAEKRRKAKWNITPRSTDWNSDSNSSRFGLQLMSKMGWKVGNGLGRDQQGMTEPIKLTVTSDNRGVGFKSAPEDLLPHQDNFAELLLSLGSQAAEQDAPTVETSGASLEAKSQKSRARVHYHKFTRGKDLSRYSAKDLECIVGKKKLSSETPAPQATSTFILESDVVTVDRGNMVEYFKEKKKMFGWPKTEVTGSVDGSSSVEDEVEARPSFGFGFNPTFDKTHVEFEIGEDSVKVLDDEEEGQVEKREKRKSKKVTKIEINGEGNYDDLAVTVLDVNNDCIQSTMSKKDKKKSKKTVKFEEGGGFDGSTGISSDSILDLHDSTVVSKKEKKVKSKIHKTQEESMTTKEERAVEDVSEPIEIHKRVKERKSKKDKIDDIDKDPTKCQVMHGNNLSGSTKSHKKEKKEKYKRADVEDNNIKIEYLETGDELQGISGIPDKKKRKNSKKIGNTNNDEVVLENTEKTKKKSLDDINDDKKTKSEKCTAEDSPAVDTEETLPRKIKKKHKRGVVNTIESGDDDSTNQMVIVKTENIDCGTEAVQNEIGPLKKRKHRQDNKDRESADDDNANQMVIVNTENIDCGTEAVQNDIGPLEKKSKKRKHRQDNEDRESADDDNANQMSVVKTENIDCGTEAVKNETFKLEKKSKKRKHRQDNEDRESADDSANQMSVVKTENVGCGIEAVKNEIEQLETKSKKSNEEREPRGEPVTKRRKSVTFSEELFEVVLIPAREDFVAEDDDDEEEEDDDDKREDQNQDSASKGSPADVIQIVNGESGKRRPVLLVKCQQECNRTKIIINNDDYVKPKSSCTMYKICTKPKENCKSIQIGTVPNKNGKTIVSAYIATKDGANAGLFKVGTEQIEGGTLGSCLDEQVNHTTIMSNAEENQDCSRQTSEERAWTDSGEQQQGPDALMMPDLENSERYLSIECGQVEEYMSAENEDVDIEYSPTYMDVNRNTTLIEPKQENTERYMSIESNTEHEINIPIQQGIEQVERYMSIDSKKEVYETCTSIKPEIKCSMSSNCNGDRRPVYTLTASKRPSKRKNSLSSRYQVGLYPGENGMKDLIAGSYNAETMTQAKGLEMGLDLSYENRHPNRVHNADFSGHLIPDMNVYTVTEEIVQTTPLNLEEFPSINVDHEMSRHPEDMKSHFEVVEVLVVRESQEVDEANNKNIVIVNKAHNNIPLVPVDPNQVEEDGICHYMRYEMIDGRRTKVFECGICHRGFKHQYTLMRHLPTHTDERNFPCEVCGKAFRQMSTLIQHGAIHSNARPYRCDICSNTFNRVSTLISHKKTHTGNKPHVCTYCGKRFHQKGNLRNHVFTHTNERPYKCEMCGKGFNQKSNLICHRIRYHTAQQEYECEICNARFPKKHALKSHQFYKHGIQFTVGSGRKKLADKTNLESALKMSKIKKNDLTFNPNYKHESNYDCGTRDINKQHPFKIDLAMPHLIIDTIKSVAYAAATALGHISFALYKPLDGSELLMRVAPSHQHGKQTLFQATVEDLKATQIPVGGNFSQSTPHQFTVQTVTTFVQKYNENGHLEVVEEPEGSSCCQIKIEPMFHSMALSAEATGWQDQANILTNSEDPNGNQAGGLLPNYNPFETFPPNTMWNPMDWENQLQENANQYEDKLMLNAQECYTFSQGDQHFNTALNTEFEPPLEGQVLTVDPLDIGSCNQFDGLSSYVEYNYINQDDTVQLSLQTLEVASEPVEGVSALGPFDYTVLTP